MEGLILLAVCAVLYIVYASLLSGAVKSPNGRYPFWWCFFFGVIGAIIVILLDIRDKKL
jgi:drug/metabolite transporter (DMT)-like permease